jgi:Bacterial membrane protein YfhO
LRANDAQPFRIVGAGPVLFPNSAALYGFEDVRAHDPMTNGRYIALLAKNTPYDPSNYFAPWSDFESPLLDFLNVKYAVTPPRGEMPGRFRLVYDGNDGRIFENTAVLPRFYPIRNVVAVFEDKAFDERMRGFDEWPHTALLDSLELEAPEMYGDFFNPRPANAPIAETRLLEATPTSYRLHIKAPRWSLIASSIPWWPGWKVERNGARVDPIRVNDAFLGFAVPEGELDVRVWYDPWTFRIGAIVSLATILALVAYQFLGARRDALSSAGRKPPVRSP